jgi:hypothetical protein
MQGLFRSIHACLRLSGEQAVVLRNADRTLQPEPHTLTSVAVLLHATPFQRHKGCLSRSKVRRILS